MKPIIIKITLLLFAFITFIQSVQSQPNPPANEGNTTAAVQSELKKLRFEMLQQRIEFQEWKIKQLDRDLQRVLNEQQQLQDQAQAISRQIAELDAQAPEPIAPQPNAIEERQAMKSALQDEELKRIQVKLQPLNERASELNSQINQEQTVLQELHTKTKALTAAKDAA
ncbi:MAG: hypothetical protein JST84_11220 [Acidobacteria bacterium]|nr:hypothetical protein [Acidobacteriota bacterium]